MSSAEIIPTNTIVRGQSRGLAAIEADICILGAGISGISAALEAARLGQRVVLADGAPAIGGQAIGSIIGTIIGLYSHGPEPIQLTHGIADEIIADLGSENAILRLQESTVLFQYDEVRLADQYQRTTRSPSENSWSPRRTPSWVTVRRKWMTGDATRTISSTAVGARLSRSASHRSR
jgi:NADPH-dependent 2,4-dienoyl-CoA reductase/sulfur reductase-like enzyme